MKYMGSKSRIAKDIVPILQKIIDDNNIKIYIEPFCGGCNIIDKISCTTRIAADKNEYLVELLENIDNIDKLPNIITKDVYDKVRSAYNKKTNEYEKWYIGAVGFLASYNGRFFDGGYSGIVKTKNGQERNYYNEALRNLYAQKEQLKQILFEYKDYKDFYNYIDCLFYMDPPYKDTKQYGTSKNFNHNEFWEFCRDLSKENIVIISEHNAPDDFECIWQNDVKRTIDINKRIDVTEKLFIHKSIVDKAKLV